ncbi:MAG: Protein phosphatase 2C [Syntrophorhabdaceae bacterium PtaU1.Bin034]|nr:MAG: Protein phosphatase 2C [Syntrophorhabdaceae bacterium PtaU1.Bin034]
MIRYGIAETIGFRKQMEDAHAIWDREQPGLFGAEVYDGHAGSSAAVIAAEMLTPYFINLHKITCTGSSEKHAFTAAALREAYLATDRYIVDQGTESGTAAATLYICEEKFIAANAGDTRIVMGNGAGFVQLTIDHKPDLPGERARIEAAGGRVLFYDVPRVQGTLAMSRALGDASLKPYVTAEPRVVEGSLGWTNDIAVIACDGLWDVFTSEEAVLAARAAGNPEEAAQRLQNQAIERGSTDNITVIVLDLRSYTAACKRDSLRILGVLDRAAEGTT